MVHSTYNVNIYHQSGHLALIRPRKLSGHHLCGAGDILGRRAQHLHGLHQVHDALEAGLVPVVLVLVRALELAADLLGHVELLIVPVQDVRSCLEALVNAPTVFVLVADSLQLLLLLMLL